MLEVKQHAYKCQMSREMLTLAFLLVCGSFSSYYIDNSLFKRLISHIRRVEEEVRQFSGTVIHIPIYIMTSQVNRQEIEDNIHLHYSLFIIQFSLIIPLRLVLFILNQFYGLQKEQVIFFHQGSFPCIDIDGHFIMQEQHKVGLCLSSSSSFLYYFSQLDCTITRWKWWFILCSSSMSYRGGSSSTRD